MAQRLGAAPPAFEMTGLSSPEDNPASKQL